MTDLSQAPYVSLRTFRKSGTPVDTPVWLAPGKSGEHFLFSAANAGKVKRIRQASRAQVATCDMRGGNVGTWQDCEASIVSDPDEIREAYRHLIAKYGWQMRVTNFFSRLTGKIHQRAVVRLDLL